MAKQMNSQVVELLLQSLEHEKGGVLVYETALKCALNPDLKREWSGYLDETREHVRVLTDVIGALKLDLYQETPGRQVVRYLGSSLVHAMQMALTSAPREAAELVACECVVLAETKDHLDWELIGKCAKQLPGDQRQLLANAYEQIEDQEDEHLYHSKGWCRELWIKSLGMHAILPPPEEVEDVKTAKQAAEAQEHGEQLR
jgi:rubrerythrin